MSNYRNQRREQPKFDTSKFKTTWITDRFNGNTIAFAEEFGEYLVKNRLTSSQIRIIYGEVKRIESALAAYNPQQEGSEGKLKKYQKDFLLLKPKLAYAASRAGTTGILAFKDVMDKAHSAVSLEVAEMRNHFENFADFFEAILAYHKAKGGRD